MHTNMGCLTSTQTTRMEIFCINVKLTQWENDPLQSISKSAEQTKKSRKIALPQITANVF